VVEYNFQIDLHYYALKDTTAEAYLFFLAKALELGRKMLPGKRNDEKQRSLANGVGANLRRPLTWLFDMANNRKEIRHVVKKSRTIDLHPGLNAEERRDYLHDADLVLRTIVCQEIGLEPILVR
jgi:hypothetical protein